MPGIPHIAPAVAVSATGTTLLDLCCRVADTVGFRLPTAVTDTAVAGDTARVVLVDEFRDDEAGQELTPGGGGWLYVASGAQAQTQRRIVGQPEAGYVGAMGAVTLSRPFDAALVAGSAIHVTSPLPMRRHLGVPGYREAINEGLALIWTAARLTLTGNGTYEYDLSDYAAYLQLGELQIVGISDTRWLGANEPSLRVYGAPTVVTNGVERTLVVPTLYSSSDTFYLDILVRADRLIHDGASWTFVTSGTPGLQDDTDQCACPGDWAYTFGVWKTYQHLHTLIQMRNGVDPQDRERAAADVLAKRLTWASAARAIKEREFPRRKAFAAPAAFGVAVS